MEDSSISPEPSPYALVFKSLSLIPFSHSLLGLLLIFFVFLYNFLEIHFFQDLFTAFRGDPVSLTYHPQSELYQSVASKCHILHSRFLPTPWLSSPHLQTAFLSFFGNAPDVTYKRHLFHVSDGGTIALDWLMYSDVKECASNIIHTALQNEKTPIMIVIPGLTSDSDSASDCFYNAGWTEDIRKVIDHIHSQYPEALLYAVGTSIGSNILVKYLGEEGVNCPLIGAAAVCSPWDLLICDRFINRRLVQKFYDRVLTVGLQGYAQLHQSILSRLTDWDSIKKSRSVRDFDNCATRVLGKFETVDTYYRHSSSVNFVGNVSVPLLCVSALDDPVCTGEAIPWDECRKNENIVLAATKHGGHLAYYEGLTANSLWWVRAVDEFFLVLHSSPLRNKRKMERPSFSVPMESSIDQGPYVNVMKDGMVTAASESQNDNAAENITFEDIEHVKKDEDNISNIESSDKKANLNIVLKQPSDQSLNDLIVPVKRRIDQLSRQSRNSIWLLAYVAIITTWPLVGSALFLFIKRKFKSIVPAALLRR